MFEYDVNSGDTYHNVAKTYFSNLTTVEAMEWFNSYSPTNIPNSQLNVPVDCSCGNSAVSEDYGLFITYPLRPGETLASIAQNVQLDETLLQNYNPGVIFSQGSGFVYIPGKDPNGSYRPLESRSKGLAGGAITGIIVAVIAGVLLLAGGACFGFYRKNWRYKPEESNGAGRVLTGIKVHKSVEYSYEELARDTDNFSLANKIGQGGFGAVYYAELRGEKAAIKKMDTQASKEFLAELNVLTRVHHSNLVMTLSFQKMTTYMNLGLAKLIEVGSTSLPTRLVGTFGYMPPEYAQCGEVSPKVDVYAFGVVIYELISAKEAVVRADSSGSEWRGLVGLFEEVLNQPDPKEDLWETTIHLTQCTRWLNLPKHVRM